MTVKSLTLKDAREKAQTLQDNLGKVFAEAKTDDGQYDYNKVTYFGAEVKGSVSVAEKVKAMNDELDEVMGHVETLEAADNAAKAHADRGKARRGFGLPGGGEKGGDRPRLIKSLGELVSDDKLYLDWAEKGAKGQIDLAYDDVWATDLLAMATSGNTIGAKALMTTAAGYAPEAVRLPGFVEHTTRPIELIDILPTSRTGNAQVTYMEETTRNHGAVEVAEGGEYAESEFVFTEKSSPVRKIGDSLPVTDEQLEDVPFMGSYINGRLSFGCRQRLDRQALIGDGAGSNLRGLKNIVGIQVQARGGDPVPDVFYRMMTKIRMNGQAVPTHHVMHPLDWEGIRLLRTADGIYVFGSPSEAGPDRLWGLPVAQNSADAQGTGYTGSFQQAWISLVERRGVDVQIGYVNDQFKKGQRTVRADLRTALVAFRPPAFCQGTGLAG
ncbi:phage major capsid protein [Sphingopyxis sp. GW247-27LB]|uniref:phage major capsid protein n=1 Tax=Sphingopyxis sp. GW247-27LB TaxID=2012632 RepID=UPI000BA54435|nr:phage major capsid protein [Sphingopyxis sp. GW247-27LB]PAL20212.1 phage major capsid protein [Sphingopyxis sp. GW247-27LB]